MSVDKQEKVLKLGQQEADPEVGPGPVQHQRDPGALAPRPGTNAIKPFLHILRIFTIS